MKTREEDYSVIIADEGKFLISDDGTVWGTEIVLGENDVSTRFQERPIEEMPQPTEEEELLGMDDIPEE